LLSRIDPAARRLLLRLPLAAAAALAVWFAGGSDVYERALTGATEATLRAVERPTATFLEWQKGTVTIRRSDFSSRSQLPVYDPSSIAGNAVILLALLLATPGVGTTRWVVGSLLSLLVLFLSHVVHFALAIETLYATELGAWSVYAYAKWQRTAIAGGRYFFDIALKYALPFVTWALFVLIPLLKERDAERAKQAAAPAKTWRERRKRRKR
jgi:hypothetical protein